jgi:hypothetical protein
MRLGAYANSRSEIEDQRQFTAREAAQLIRIKMSRQTEKEIQATRQLVSPR